MPLVKRTVSPVNVSRGTIPPGLNRDELQCVANGTMANLIRQLSSLSNHAENIFGDIYRDAMKLHHKSRNLEQRIERLMNKAVHLDSSGEQGTLGEMQMRKAFKSSMLVDQHTLDRETLPLALSGVYSTCDPPPNLDALNPYRDDPRSALSLYTNPSFFFDLWRKEMLKDCGDGRRRMKSPTDGSKSPKKRRKAVQQQSQDLPRPAANRLISHRPAQIGVMSFPEEYQAPQALGLQLHRNHGGHFQSLQSSSPIVPPPGMSARVPLMIERNDARPDVCPQTDFMMKRDLPPPDLSLLGIDDDDDLPPPPPPLMHTSIIQQIQPENTMQFVPAENLTMPAPPPPPPPPPANLPAFSAPATFAANKSIENKVEQQMDPRNNMLAQIREGRTLRKVNREAEEAERAAAEENDVAAILRRRMEHVLGNDDDSQSSGGDSEEWDD